MLRAEKKNEKRNLIEELKEKFQISEKSYVMFFLLLLKVYPKEEQNTEYHQLLMKNIEKELNLYHRKSKHS